jgi:hypothetical protein
LSGRSWRARQVVAQLTSAQGAEDAEGTEGIEGIDGNGFNVRQLEPLWAAPANGFDPFGSLARQSEIRGPSSHHTWLQRKGKPP